MKRLIAGFALALLSATSSASANEPKTNWTGCYVGASVGMASTINNASIDVVGGPSILGIDGLGSSGASFGGQVGCDMLVSKQFVIGAWRSYDWHNQEWSISSGLIGGALATMSVDSVWAIGGRAGVLVNDNVLIYGLVGYTQMETSGVRVPLLAMNLSTSDFSGMVFGGGMEMALGNGLFLTGEYRYSRFDSEAAAFIPNVINLNMEPDMHSVSARLSYRFGMPGQ